MRKTRLRPLLGLVELLDVVASDSSSTSSASSPVKNRISTWPSIELNFNERPRLSIAGVSTLIEPLLRFSAGFGSLMSSCAGSFVNICIVNDSSGEPEDSLQIRPGMSGLVCEVSVLSTVDLALYFGRYELIFIRGLKPLCVTQSDGNNRSHIYWRK